MIANSVGRRPNCCTAGPPRSGPITLAGEAAALTAVIARLRWVSGTVLRSQASPAVHDAAEKTPLIARSTSSCQNVVANPNSVAKAYKYKSLPGRTTSSSGIVAATST